MDREAIKEVLRSAPPPGDPQRIHYIGAHCGQLFGWMTGPNAHFLVDWLPDAALAYPRQPMRIVEVGTFAGSTARGLIALTGGGSAVCIDNFMDMNPQTLGKHASGRAFWEATMRERVDLSAYATLVEGDSGEVGRAWKQPIDLLLVDGDHAYASAKRDIELFAQHVVTGGYCLVDDYHMPDVALACHESFKAVDTGHGGPFWRIVHRPTTESMRGSSPNSILVMQRV